MLVVVRVHGLEYKPDVDQGDYWCPEQASSLR